jgi:hypothetical protein
MAPGMVLHGNSAQLAQIFMICAAEEPERSSAQPSGENLCKS